MYRFDPYQSADSETPTIPLGGYRYEPAEEPWIAEILDQHGIPELTEHAHTVLDQFRKDLQALPHGPRERVFRVVVVAMRMANEEA